MTRPETRDLGLLILRGTVGGTLAAHGVQKLFGLLGGTGLDGTADSMHLMGFRPGRPNAMAAGLGETSGGVLLLLGLATPVGGAVALGPMAAACAVHASNGFFAMGGGMEHPALLGAASAALALTGPGRFSFDQLLGGRLAGPWVATVALALSAAGTGAALVRRRRILHAEGFALEAEAAEALP
jgi:putative oxidoreductase